MLPIEPAYKNNIRLFSIILPFTLVTYDYLIKGSSNALAIFPLAQFKPGKKDYLINYTFKCI